MGTTALMMIEAEVISAVGNALRVHEFRILFLQLPNFKVVFDFNVFVGDSLV